MLVHRRLSRRGTQRHSRHGRRHVRPYSEGGSAAREMRRVGASPCRTHPRHSSTRGTVLRYGPPDLRRLVQNVRDLGTIQEHALTSAGARHPPVHRPPRAPRGPLRARRPGQQPEVVVAPADAGRVRLGRPGPVGVDRPRPGQDARRGREGPLRRAGGRRRVLRAARCGRGATSRRTSPRTAGTSAGSRTVRRRSATSRPSSASPRCCRSTPAASASWPVTTSRPPATSVSRSSASACSTGTATSSSRCRARAGSRRATRCSTPTSCRSRCSASPTAPAPRSRSTCPTARRWSRASGSSRSGGSRC